MSTVESVSCPLVIEEDRKIFIELGKIVIRYAEPDELDCPGAVVLSPIKRPATRIAVIATAAVVIDRRKVGIGPVNTNVAAFIVRRMRSRVIRPWLKREKIIVVLAGVR